MLKRVCDPVSRAGAEPVVRDLVDTMRSLERCVGLAAPQIGEPVRVAVVDVRSHPAAQAHNGLLVLINPVVTAASGQELGREGCQSLPGITADVTRSRRLTLLSELQEIWSAGFEARAVQHELDHLDGVLILDRVASVAAIHVRDPLKQPLPHR
ncbi:MAG: peptide deformylase [Candidatus Dormibacteraeota bacterium]|jgi:peptide deformylase|nr:peptide deformylase [Candidatus Dormibacteraeota bacterium]